MCQFKSALLIPRFPSSDGFDIFHRDGVDSHTKLMELANINPNDTGVNVAKLELVPNYFYGDVTDINTWNFILDEKRRPDWLDDSMLSDAEHELRQICSRCISKCGKYTVFNIDGNERWTFNGKYHREDGPAIVWKEGHKRWYINGELHREDGPAVENGNEHSEWYRHGKLHREDGPAIEYADGSKQWWVNGKRHREDGPAIEYANGAKFWYVNDKFFTEEEFNNR